MEQLLDYAYSVEDVIVFIVEDTFLNQQACAEQAQVN